MKKPSIAINSSARFEKSCGTDAASWRWSTWPLEQAPSICWSRAAEARAIECDFSLQISAICKKRTYDLQVESVLPKTCKENKLAHKMVARCMMHGPCGVVFPNAPCMEEGKCKKQYPRKFQSKTMMDVNGYLIYCHRDMGRIVLVHGIELDNHWVVPHNVY